MGQKLAAWQEGAGANNYDRADAAACGAGDDDGACFEGAEGCRCDACALWKEHNRAARWHGFNRGCQSFHGDLAALAVDLNKPCAFETCAEQRCVAELLFGRKGELFAIRNGVHKCEAVKVASVVDDNQAVCVMGQCFLIFWRDFHTDAEQR